MFIRFVIPNPISQNGARAGFLRAAYCLRDRVDIEATDALLLKESLDWFDTHLMLPTRFNRSRSKGAYRRNTVGLSWFRPDAAAAIAKAREVIRVLKLYGYQVDMIKTNSPGYIIYEDDNQIVAEPFAETPT